MDNISCCFYDRPTHGGNRMKLEYAVSVLIRERNKLVKEINKLESDRKKLHKHKLNCDSSLFSENEFSSLLDSINHTVSKTIPENIRLLKYDLNSINDALFHLCQLMGNNETRKEYAEITCS